MVTSNFTWKQAQEHVTKQQQWPGAYIKSIDSSGLMKIKFIQRMKIPDHPEYIQNETITLNGTVYPIVKLVVVTGKYSNESMLKFNWTYVNYTTQELLI